MLNDPHQLRALARSPDPDVRRNLVLAMGDVCAEAPLPRSEAGGLVREMLIELTPKVERDVRLRLAARLASVDWAPRDLVVLLANDEIGVAERVLRRSLALLEDDLVAVAEGRTSEHRAAIAGRPAITERVVTAAARFGEPDVLKTLLENDSARIPRAVFDTCLAAAEHEPELQPPLVRREDLPSELAENLYRIVEEELRAELAGRFPIDRASLDAAIADSSRAARAEAPALSPTALIEELAARGELTPDFLVKTAVSGRAEMFDLGVAKLAGLDFDEVRIAIESGGAWAAALACRAAGIDRADFPRVHRGLAESQRLPRQLPTEAGRAGADAFDNVTPAGAAAALRRLARMA